MTLRDDFAFLEKESAGEAGEWRAHHVGHAGLAAEVAIDSDGHRHLLIPVEASKRITRDNRSAGIQIGHYSLVKANGIRQSFLDIACRKDYLHDLFCTIADEMLQAIAATPDAPDKAAIAVLDRWRDLLARERSEGPSIEKLMGIYGELWHLHRIAEHEPSAITVWHGPKGSSHDLRLGPLAIEVKTTRKTGWRVSIAGLHQLEVPEGGKLYLSVFRLEAGGGGESISEVVEALIALGADGHFLHSQLAEVGLPPSQLAKATQLFEVLEHRVYQVGPDFPRLTLKDFGALPTGIASVKYDIDLTAWDGEPMAADEVDALHLVFAKS